jgi:hypothetical protein
MFALVALLLAQSAAAPPARVDAAPPAAVGREPPASIYKVDPLVDGAVIASTAGATLFTYVFGGGLITRRCPCDPNEVNALDRHVIGNHSDAMDVLSDVEVGAAIAGPVIVDWTQVGASRALLEDLTVAGEVLAVNGVLVTIAKYSVQRPLPRVYAGQAPQLANGPGGYRSFYSGHTSVAVASMSAAAMTWNLRHGGSPWPWVLTAAVGGTVAAERVLAGRHFYSDVAVGALAGFAVGTLVPFLHERGGLTVGPGSVSFSRKF